MFAMRITDKKDGRKAGTYRKRYIQEEKFHVVSRWVTFFVSKFKGGLTILKELKIAHHENSLPKKDFFSLFFDSNIWV
jgi:hypothetical protein